MKNPVFDSLKIAKLQEAMKSINKIVVVAHKSPDGDSIGSSTALAAFLAKNDFSVTICHPDPAPAFLNWMVGAKELLTYQNESDKVIEKIDEADLIFCLDFNQMDRLGAEMAEVVSNSKAKKVMIDHHLYPSEEFDIVFSDTQACSTAQLVYEFIAALNKTHLIDKAIGASIYCGIMTDTGSFRFPSTAPKTHRIIADLMELGVNGSEVHENVYDTNTLGRIKLRAFALNNKLELMEKCKTVIISLKEDELHAYDFQHGDTEGLVNVGLSIEGINKSIFLKELNGIVKISFRSKGLNNPINEFAIKYFNGGGHANAAGGAFEGTMEEALKLLKLKLNEEYV
jgi:phosphoesterase RecJ-like protein